MRYKSKTIMMIGGGIQEILAVKSAQNSGFKVLVTDRSPSAPCFKYADFTAVIDGRDIEALIAFTILNKERLNVRGVFTLTELVTSVAAVAEAANLPGVSLVSAVACQNKELSKKIWIEKNIPTPRGKTVKTLDEAKSSFTEFDQNVFVKPLVGFGGKDSRKIVSYDVLQEVFFDNTREMVIEELIEGSMHDVNGLISNDGKLHPMGIVDRLFLDEFPVEKQISTPSILNTTQQNQLYALLENAVKALGINWGPVKGDAVLQNGEFKILEVAPRLHGPKNSIYLLPYSGFDCLAASFNTITGDNESSIDEVRQNLHCVCEAVMPLPGAKFDREGTEKARFKKGIIEVLIFKKDNAVINRYRNATDVPAYVFSAGNDYKDCTNYLKNTGLFTK